MPTGPDGKPIPGSYGPGPMPGPMPQGGPMLQGGTQDPLTGKETKVSDIFARNGGDAFAVRDPSQAEAVQRTAQELGMAPEEVINAVEKELSDNFGDREPGETPLHNLEISNARNGAANKLLAQQNPQPYGPPRRGA